MRYRDDNDLAFLKFCENDDLEILVHFLIKGKDGNERLTETLSSNERFKQCGKEYTKIWDLIAKELQCFGADSIATLLRLGKGVLYREILTDVCNKLKVNYHSKDNIQAIEENLLLKIVEVSLEDMTEEEKRELANRLNINIANLSTVAIMAALQGATRMGAFTTYQLALIVANSTAKFIAGRGLALSANAGLTRGIAVFAGPIGWTISGLLTLPMITGPAYRVTIPSVIQVAYMRQKGLAKKEGII